MKMYFVFFLFLSIWSSWNISEEDNGEGKKKLNNRKKSTNTKLSKSQKKNFQENEKRID